MKGYKIIIALLLIAQSCATTITPNQARLYHADLLFKAKKYNEALAEYKEILKTNPPEDIAAEAQFSIAYTLIYYDNPNLNYKEASEEFNKFLIKYPFDKRYNEAKNWYTVLTILNATRKENFFLLKKIEQLKQLDIKRGFIK